MSMTLLATMLFTMNFPMVVCKTSVGLRGRVTFVTNIGDTLAVVRHSVNCDLMHAGHPNDVVGRRAAHGLHIVENRKQPIPLEKRPKG